MSRDTDFLSRWARRKAEVREEEKREQDAKSAPPEALEAPEAQAGEITKEELAALPDPDSLEHGADFKPFLRPGVPQALRHRALRRIWRVNPSIGFLDGMNEYDLDYTDAATVVENLKTAYQVGRGFVLPEEEDEKEAEESVALTAAPEDAAPEDSTSEDAASEGADPTAEAAGPASHGRAEDDGLTRTEAVSDLREEDETADLAEAPVGVAMQGSVSTQPDSNAPPPAPGEAAARRWARFSTSESSR